MTSFLMILLTILKILGIILLSILAFIVAILLIVLLVPLRYRSKFSMKDKEVKFYAAGTWLLRIISVSYSLGESNPLKIKIFGHSLNLKKEKIEKKEKKNKPSKISNVPNESKKEDLSVIQNEIENKIAENNSTDISHNEGKSNSDIKTNSSNRTECNDSNYIIEKEIDDSNSDNEESQIGKNDSKNNSSYDKIKNKFDIIKSEEFEKALALCKKELLNIFKIILPKHWYIEGVVGFEDPATTGKILAFTGMLYGLIHNHVSITGDFENNIIDLKGKFLGHITLFKLMCVGLRLYFNKNLKSIIKQFKGE